ncbi:MAG: DUF1842 domain-containing protein [Thermodesulfobacteriota bacterium]|nr:DUF1842 domain-containing protein [Thermodesulfobacteriota bacterium]
MEKSETKVGLFIVSYEIGGNIPGAPLFEVNFSVYTPAKTLAGIGQITQTTHPPLDIGTNLHGQYKYMRVFPKIGYIIINATGYPIINWPVYRSVDPFVISSNSELRMVITEDWKSGTANYKYIDSKGIWQEITDVPAKVFLSKSII